jgi:hypothetical protein
MRRADRWLLALFVLLAFAAAALATRVARQLEQGGAARLELGRVRPTALSARTLARFAHLSERVLVTYYVSPAARMPAAMRPMELEVTDLLAALRARFPGRFDFSVVDPDSAPGLDGFAARRKVAPFRVRTVTHDAWDERTVWSTLALSYGAHPEIRLDGLGPEHLPHLQELLVGWLDELDTPRQPRIALAAPEGFEGFADALAEKGTVTRVDLDAGAEVPASDVLFWLRPAHVSGEQLRALERRLANGTSVIVAGSRLEPLEEVREDVPYVAFRDADAAFDALATHFGLASEPGLVLDTTAEELEFGGAKIVAPHWVRCIAPAQDFHRFPLQPNGTLLFRSPSTLTPVPARLVERGWTAEVLATSSDNTWIVPAPPREPVTLASLVRDPAQAAAKQALMVALRPDSPWRGELVFAAAATPFADGFFQREHVAHARLLDVLLKETTASERLVVASLDLGASEPLPPFTPAARLASRGFAIALPVVLLVFVLHRRRLRGAALGLGRTLARAGRRLALPLGAGAAVLAFVAVARAFDAGLDLTSDGWNELAPAAQAIAARAGSEGTIEATLYLSAEERLPPALRAPARALENELDDFARAGARFARTRIVPEDLSEPERAAIAARGIGANLGATEDDGVTRVARFTCALRLAREGHEVVLEFRDARAFERLEFRLAYALARLGGERARRVAFASDIPRLSAAESYEYQKQNLFAPGGTDVYALARASLAQNDLEVVHVNPRAPVMPEQADALVWLQPRRSIEPMIDVAVRYLVGGGTLVLASQHFHLKPQQFRGGDFEPQFWPQPQNPDLEYMYFPELSIELPREVLFDALCLPITAESQVTGRQGAPDFERQASALPFQIRLSAAGYAPHALTRGLGDQAFLFANRIRWDPARLAELGIMATPLASTSAKTWSFAWKGGWIPHELLAGPAAIEGSSGADSLGPQPLMVLFEGQFPRPTKPMRLNADAPQASAPDADATPAAPPEPPWPAPSAGKLLLIGNAEFLENPALGSDEFRGDQLLWNAVAGSVFDGELAELATRVRATRGFGLVAPRTKVLGRAFALGAGPLALVLGAAVLAALRRRTTGGVR